ncbi:hypothetical protein BH18ACT2_BH18ACT2_00430 [soil metagenome]
MSLIAFNPARARSLRAERSSAPRPSRSAHTNSMCPCAPLGRAPRPPRAGHRRSGRSPYATPSDVESSPLIGRTGPPRPPAEPERAGQLGDELVQLRLRRLCRLQLTRRQGIISGGAQLLDPPLIDGTACAPSNGPASPSARRSMSASTPSTRSTRSSACRSWPVLAISGQVMQALGIGEAHRGAIETGLSAPRSPSQHGTRHRACAGEPRRQGVILGGQHDVELGQRGARRCRIRGGLRPVTAPPPQSRQVDRQGGPQHGTRPTSSPSRVSSSSAMASGSHPDAARARARVAAARPASGATGTWAALADSSVQDASAASESPARRARHRRASSAAQSPSAGRHPPPATRVAPLPGRGRGRRVRGATWPRAAAPASLGPCRSAAARRRRTGPGGRAGRPARCRDASSARRSWR